MIPGFPGYGRQTSATTSPRNTQTRDKFYQLFYKPVMALQLSKRLGQFDVPSEKRCSVSNCRSGVLTETINKHRERFLLL